MELNDKPKDISSGERRVSYSSYSLWATCPHAWKLRYVDGYKDGGSIHTIFGQSIHFAIQEWLALRFNESEEQAKFFNMEDVFKTKLLSLFSEAITHDANGSPSYLCDQPTLREFHADGVSILKHVRKHRNEYFPTSGYELVGCEIPLEMPLNEGVKFIGYIDIVVRHKKSKEIFIYDLKTSGKGWYYEKKDPKKLNQLLLYKSFYAEQFKIDPDMITVQFIILKRKLNENSEWAQSHLSKFEPSQGKVSVNKATRSFNEFVEGAFNNDGTVRLDNLQPTPSEKNCRWCFFRNKPELCSVSQAKTK